MATNQTASGGTSEPACENCNKGGLPILPVRYTVLPKSVSAKIPAGISGARVTDVALTEHNYGLRTLREGWLYLFYVKGERGSNYWDAYCVTDNGWLWIQKRPLPDYPTIHLNCVLNGNVSQLDFIAIKQPEKCGEVYIAFSEQKWSEDIFDLYRDNADLRKKRMQCIEPAKWIANPKHEHAVEATEQTINAIVEYMPGLDGKQLEPSDQQISNPDGSHKPDVLKLEKTRYPLYIRQTSPDSASKALLGVMNKVGRKEGGNNPPMVLALWDAVGITHELNGFRNDPVAWFDQYVQKEYGLKINALSGIETAKKAIESRNTRWAMSQYERIKAVNMPGINIADPKKIAEDNTIKDWSKYEAHLQGYKDFQQKYEAFQSAVYQLQEDRTGDIEKWLKSSLLHDALEDYTVKNDELVIHDLFKILSFDNVIGDALYGLTSTLKGIAVVDNLIKLQDATAPGSLIWRVFALNQMGMRKELKQYISQAAGEKKREFGSETVGKVVDSVTEKLKKVNEAYKKFAELADQTDPNKISPLGRLIQRMNLDKFGLAVGDRILNDFKLDKISDSAGEKMVKVLMMQRAGISSEDTLMLVRKQAELEKLSRQEIINRVSIAETFLSSGADDPSLSNSKELYKTWDEIKSTKEGKAGLRTGRIAFLGLALESVNIFHLVQGALAGKPDKDLVLKLINSGISVVSSVITIIMVPYQAVLTKSSTKVMGWKLVGGTLGVFSAAISTCLDYGKIEEARKKGQYEIIFLLQIKTLVDVAVGAGILLDTISSTAPLLKTIASRYGMEATVALIESFAKWLAKKAVFRVVSILTGWEGFVALIFLDMLIAWITPDELETWCSLCAFGKGGVASSKSNPDATPGFDAAPPMDSISVEPYPDVSTQEKAFGQAMISVGLS